jgi:hypothetical protein
MLRRVRKALEIHGKSGGLHLAILAPSASESEMAAKAIESGVKD